MARVVHFEIPVEDADRARDFYADTFGWELAGFGDEGYWLATTGEEGERGIDGALISGSELHASPVIIIGVEDLGDAVDRAASNGATILLERQTIPGVGYSAYLRDPEDNVIGLFQPDGSATP